MIQTEVLLATCQAALDFQIAQRNLDESVSESDSSMLEEEEYSNISMKGTTVVASALLANNLKDKHIRVNG